MRRTLAPSASRPVLLLVLVLALLPILALPSGCATMRRAPTHSAANATDAAVPFSGEYQVSARLATHPPRSIAVLPFSGDPTRWSFVPEDAAPTDIVRRGLYNHLAALPLRDVELADVDARLARAGLLSPAEVELQMDTDPRALRDVLDVDAVVQGRVTHFDRMYVGLVSQVAVGCDVTMTDLTTGEVLWSAQYVSRALAGGVDVTPVGLALGALASAWNLRPVQLLRETDEAFREIVATLTAHLPRELAPPPAALPPRLDLFAAGPDEATPGAPGSNATGTDNGNGAPGLTLGAGRGALLTVVGDPGARAVATVYRPDGSAYAELDMAPLAPALRARAVDAALARLATMEGPAARAGTDGARVREYLAGRAFYRAVLPVPPGAEAYGLTAVARLERSGGGAAQAVLSGGPLNLDGLPPAAPAILDAVGADQSLHLRWRPVDHGPGTTYEVQAGPAPDGPFVSVAHTAGGRVELAGLENFAPLAVRMRAVDAAGNAGPFGAAVTAMPAPEPGLAALDAPGAALPETIAYPLLLRVADGPCAVRGATRIVPGGALYLGPGAVLRFAPGARLVVEGGALAAFGEPDAPVRLVPAQDNAGPGAFDGVALHAPARALLRHVAIVNAAVALEVRDAAPELTGLRIEGAGQAALLLGDGARPVVTCSRFAHNRGMGAVVAEGVPAPRFRANLFLDNTPFDVQNFSSVELDLSANAWAEPVDGANGAPTTARAATTAATPPAPGRFLGAVRADAPLAGLPASCLGAPGEGSADPTPKPAALARGVQ